MARKKTKLAYITNDAARRITLRKRRHGLLKKVYELSVLCNVPACAIIYSPQEVEPEVWPSTGEAGELLNRFNATESLSKENNMMNQEKFLLKQIVKLRGQLSRIMAENDDLAGEVLLLECMAGRSVCGLGAYELGLVGRAVGRRIEAVEARILMLRSSEVETQALPLLLPAPAMDEVAEAQILMLRSSEMETQVLPPLLPAPAMEESVEARVLMLRSSQVETQALPLLLPAPAMEDTVVGGMDGWADNLLGWEEGLFSDCANLFQPDLGV
ncbi:hypothetical protein IEQ34_000986 [Dendrobium chrysotoxum]|uniref:MADS-box domain-containing protein n=1 Tax=Dendrobium chrysotoxum TaxID=161865 RepID=A0AAV7HPG7_DENCH|nr:hypothetical protein IEQ34_000986 [Dendrobium chrysotoxum]